MRNVVIMLTTFAGAHNFKSMLINTEMSTVEFLQPYTHRNVQVLDYVVVPTMTLNSYK
jgi:hypothetical protein